MYHKHIQQLSLNNTEISIKFRMKRNIMHTSTCTTYNNMPHACKNIYNCTVCTIQKSTHACLYIYHFPTCAKFVDIPDDYEHIKNTQIFMHIYTWNNSDWINLAVLASACSHMQLIRQLVLVGYDWKVDRISMFCYARVGWSNHS